MMHRKLAECTVIAHHGNPSLASVPEASPLQGSEWDHLAHDPAGSVQK